MFVNVSEKATPFMPVGSRAALFGLLIVNVIVETPSTGIVAALNDLVIVGCWITRMRASAGSGLDEPVVLESAPTGIWFR